MKRSWGTYLLVGGLIGLLALLALLQYRGLIQISASESEKAHKRVQEETDRYAADFNREIQNAYFNFQTDGESWKKKDWSAFNERYDFWREKTNYPDLITDFFFFDPKGDQAPLRYDFAQRAFVPVEMNAELSDLRARISDERTFKPVYDDIYTLALPIHDVGQKIQRIMVRSMATIPYSPKPDLRMPERFGYLAIKLNEKTINERLLTDLAAKYFGEGEFRSAVTRNDGSPVFQSLSGETRDATAALFDISSDNFIQYANKDVLSSISGERQSSLMVNSHVENRPMGPVGPGSGKAETFQIEVKRGDGPKTAVITRTSVGGEPPWVLQVQHSSGSLDAYLASTLRRNLAIGFGLLFLLAGAVAAIIISAQRAKSLAQRQIDFVSSVSHEFRTPLAVIYSAGENLADGVAKENAQVSRYGDLIKGEGKKLSTMVEQILEFAGADSGQRKYNFGETKVADIVNDALSECRPLLDEKNITVETYLAETLPSITADRSALSGAIQNLIVNSVKYGNGERWLRVSADNGGKTVRISVEDHGIGISKSDLRQVFEPFYRSRDVVDSQIHGNGLGLSLVKQIAEAHGGKVTAESEKLKGSKFTIELPV
jgi:signal transduction histidine kinase